jgi:hypothetical protein
MSKVAYCSKTLVHGAVLHVLLSHCCIRNFTIGASKILTPNLNRFSFIYCSTNFIPSNPDANLIAKAQRGLKGSEFWAGSLVPPCVWMEA